MSESPLTPEQEVRAMALNLAVQQRREVFRIKPGDDDKDPGWLAEETLHDARLYAAWIANGGDA